VPDRVIDAPVDSDLAELLEKYKGRWVAIDQVKGQIVAYGDSALEVQEKALAKHVTDPIIYRVPTHPNRTNFL
jgi:hypothetical protein